MDGQHAEDATRENVKVLMFSVCAEMLMLLLWFIWSRRMSQATYQRVTAVGDFYSSSLREN